MKHTKRYRVLDRARNDTKPGEIVIPSARRQCRWGARINWRGRSREESRPHRSAHFSDWLCKAKLPGGGWYPERGMQRRARRDAPLRIRDDLSRSSPAKSTRSISIQDESDRRRDGSGAARFYTSTKKETVRTACISRTCLLIFLREKSCLIFKKNVARRLGSGLWTRPSSACSSADIPARRPLKLPAARGLARGATASFSQER